MYKRQVITHAIHYESYIYLHKQHEYSFPGGKATKMAYDEAIRLFNLYGMNNRNGDDIVVDSLGVGAGVCSFLSAAGYSVVRYLGGAASDNSNLYRCRRVQSYLVARNYFREGKIVIADEFVDQHEWDDVYAQLCSVRRKVGMERVEDLLTKEEMRNAGITSPDRADSIAMQFATQSPMTVDVDLESVIMGNQLASAGYGI